LRSLIALAYCIRRGYIAASMSFAEIEAELERMNADQLRRLALMSWAAFVQKEGRTNEISEEDPKLLAAPDEALAAADEAHGKGHSGSEVRARLREWTSK
jgi:hypothetical protein